MAEVQIAINGTVPTFGVGINKDIAMGSTSNGGEIKDLAERALAEWRELRYCHKLVEIDCDQYENLKLFNTCYLKLAKPLIEELEEILEQLVEGTKII